MRIISRRVTLGKMGKREREWDEGGARWDWRGEACKVVGPEQDDSRGKGSTRWRSSECEHQIPGLAEAAMLSGCGVLEEYFSESLTICGTIQ